ncbi:MAG TPA: ATP-binding protein [Candidatus Hydrogenedentes bacterium]|nr:ATP-binding protein [Candidatus Hydrogenedentota bacterium]
MKTRIKLQFKAEAVYLEAVRALVLHYLKRVGVPHEKAREATLAVDEACANAIRHAYKDEPEGDITLLLRGDATTLEVVVADKGASMKIPATKKKAQQSTVRGVRAGGFGLPLMRRIFDDVRITTGAKRGNRVRMRMRLK